MKRETIINEIRRIADAQEGRAPGKVQFQRETGIKESDWSGKIWVRWNDAVIEAGLEPNERQGRFDDELLLCQYAEICRHFRRPPTNPELRLFVREREGFASHNVFAKHFGGKAGLVFALRERALETGDSDLAELLPEIEEKPSSDLGKSTTGEGYVYLLKSGDYYKIGRSDEIERRIKQISISLPEKVHLEHAIKTDDPSGIEAYWHRRFAEQRANGEWFKLSKGDLRAFKRRKFQ